MARISVRVDHEQGGVLVKGLSLEEVREALLMRKGAVSVSKDQMKKALRAAFDAQKSTYDRDRIDDSAAAAVEVALLAMMIALNISTKRLPDGGWED